MIVRFLTLTNEQLLSSDIYILAQIKSRYKSLANGEDLIEGNSETQMFSSGKVEDTEEKTTQKKN